MNFELRILRTVQGDVVTDTLQYRTQTFKGCFIEGVGWRETAYSDWCAVPIVEENSESLYRTL